MSLTTSPVINTEPFLPSAPSGTTCSSATVPQHGEPGPLLLQAVPGLLYRSPDRFSFQWHVQVPNAKGA